MEIGLTTFAETTPDTQTGEVISHARRLREVVDEIVLADEVGLDVFGVGEHHRKDYASSAPALVLAAAAAQTKHIRLTTAVTVLSSDDPVRVFEAFATLDGHIIRDGRLTMREVLKAHYTSVVPKLLPTRLFNCVKTWASPASCSTARLVRCLTQIS